MALDIKHPERCLDPLIEKANKGTINENEKKYLNDLLPIFFPFFRKLTEEGKKVLLE